MKKKEISKLSGESLDVKQSHIDSLKSIFPQAVKDGKVDFKALQLILGDDIAPDNERYGLNWAGKMDCFRHIQEPTTATLKPVKEESVDFDNTENIFIEGDNLQVLKTLQKSYHGKIKMIYIDPPYNTGNDTFIYPDRFQESKDEYLQRIGDKDVEGNLIRDGYWRKNSKDAGHFHSNWLSMMYPRLFLAKNLLRDDGVIFVSIGEDEMSNLRKLCDEIYGEENFISQIVWQKRTAPDMRTTFSEAHEYILLYGKTDKAALTLNKLPLTEKHKSRYKNPDNDPKGPWVSSDFTARGVRPNQLYGITTPSGKVYYPPEGKCWQNVEETFLEQLEKGRFYFGANGDAVPRRKNYLRETDGRVPWAWWTNSEVGHSQEGKIEVNQIFGKAEIFSTPKPVRLIQRMTQIATNSNDLVLDFFAGSCATAHAVMALNAEDDGNRKYICVQLPEPCEKESEAFKEGYKTIADIGKERIRRAANKIKEENKGKLNFDGRKLDLGFKAFRLDESNFKPWRSDIKTAKELEKQLSLFVDNVKPETLQENILYELILKTGLDLNVKVEEKKANGKKYFIIEDGKLAICLEEKITKALIEKITKLKPQKFICLDRAFASNDQLKTNTALQMEAEKIEFKVI